MLKCDRKEHVFDSMNVGKKKKKKKEEEKSRRLVVFSFTPVLHVDYNWNSLWQSTANVFPSHLCLQ